ncbi:MAG TPA: NAD-glutamate dehydrogenase domain-containing protein, partial [Terriglobales bacterium]|nr:NAD-glutamate dehydrogenase domain-containing protein [Terriglobales bacterium]
QHLKNKDIYEGGSKMVVVINAPDLQTKDRMNQRLHKVQYAFINAFLDIFVTEDGKAKDPRVVDYYGEDEPIELGPDENMHDEMIETIAELSLRRGYLLGIGIMSSKRVGINHKEYGVTSTGVVKFAEIAMREMGVDIRTDPFSVKFTGGPNGDVAGNAMRILLDRCSKAAIRLILDGTGALCDPAGIDRGELSRIVLHGDVEAFRPEKLRPGGFLLYRNERRTEGLRELYKRVDRTDAGVVPSWVTADEFNKEFDGLLFTVPADLFLPAGGRPETVDATNWKRFSSSGESGKRERRCRTRRSPTRSAWRSTATTPGCSIFSGRGPRWRSLLRTAARSCRTCRGSCAGTPDSGGGSRACPSSTGGRSWRARSRRRSSTGAGSNGISRGI